MTDRNDPSDDSVLDRRSFIGGLGALGVTTGLLGSLTSCSGGGVAFGGNPLAALEARQLQALARRNEAAQQAFDRGFSPQVDNGDESLYPNRIGSFSKGLPHNALGEVDPLAYDTLLQALSDADFALLDGISIGPRKLENPQAGLCFALEGSDPLSLTMPPAPTFDSAEEAGEMVELYWMALLRDVHFSDYDTNADVAAALADINGLSDFRGPRNGGNVAARTLFRSPTPGDLAGPYLSQLLYGDVPYGTLTISQRQRTFSAGDDHMTNFAEWLSIQRGNQPSAASSFDATPRYIRNLRDLAAYVQVDALFQAYLNAALILLGRGAPLKPGADFYAGSPSQTGGPTFGPPHLLSLLTGVATAALRTVWYQKWFVHRRLRPEAFGGRVEVHTNGGASYPIHPDVLNSSALSRVQTNFGTGHLPMAYPEGSPRHPAYGAGHNTVAAACGTMLKAFFDENFVLSNPVVPDAAGTALLPYSGPDAGNLTVGGEIDKLIGNIAQGRNCAGVHWRTDYTGSVTLGEAVAENILRDQKNGFSEAANLSFTRLDGSLAQI